MQLGTLNLCDVKNLKMKLVRYSHPDDNVTPY